MRRIPALLIAAGLAAAPASAVAGPSSDPWSNESTQVAKLPLPEPLPTVARALWSPFHGMLQPPAQSEPPAWLRPWIEATRPRPPAQTTMLARLRSMFGLEPAGPVCRAP